MRSLARFVIPFLAALCVIGCARKAGDGARPLQGVWKVTELHDKGKKLDADAFQHLSVVVAKDRLQMISKDAIAEEFVIRVDPAKTPGEIDFVYVTGDNQGKTEHGIFTVEGSSIKLCVANIGKARPTQFDAQEKPDWTYMALQRKNP